MYYANFSLPIITLNLYLLQSDFHAYPALSEYMGLEFTSEVLALNMPEYLPQNQQVRCDGVEMKLLVFTIHHLIFYPWLTLFYLGSAIQLNTIYDDNNGNVWMFCLGSAIQLNTIYMMIMVMFG